MNIVLIGTGNTATVLGRKFKEAGHTIAQIYGRDASAASELAYILDSESTNYWSVVNKEADIYILAVADIAIDELLREVNLPQKTVVHTAASVSKKILEKASGHYGVFYPLQSLKKEQAVLPEIPIIIDASDEATLALLEELGDSISTRVVEVNDDQRAKLHLAAVVCNNFVNHLYSLIQEYCIKESLDFNLLLPLIRETSSRLENMDPSLAQTGPALRNDTVTIEKHTDLLRQHPQLKNLYLLFTKSIQQQA
jgi:predicted short-subunit dehydrogenase-like oxidoreductase (DUF2520 family)